MRGGDALQPMERPTSAPDIAELDSLSADLLQRSSSRRSPIQDPESFSYDLLEESIEPRWSIIMKWPTPDMVTTSTPWSLND